ncbi:MAG: PIG-L family deacetylase [Nitrospirae bacterium]|nr:PIG-L family deacetylase [Candidatus Manganitrophaceae bacterium]
MSARGGAEPTGLKRALAGWTGSTVAIVAAHPDDETIGAGGVLPRFKAVTFLHLTDGAPRDGRDAAAAGLKTREAYAAARRRELLAAAQLAGVPPSRCIELGGVDQEASLYFECLTRRLADRLNEIQPELIFTHPYEGGHPDHDAAALVVCAACRLLEREGKPFPVVAEFTSYHAQQERFTAGLFLPVLPAGGSEQTVVVLSEAERELKRRMFSCFMTQQKVLSAFPIAVERFRPAPIYDFTQPPHPGRLHYESFDWGITGARWRGLAEQALRRLGLEGPL